MDACDGGSDMINRYFPKNFKYKILKEKKLDYQNFECDLRVALNNSDDFREWLERFKENSNTDWLLRQSKISEDTVLNQYYVCHRSSYAKKRKYEDAENYSESDFKCKAFISVRILKGGKPACYHDPFIKYGYRTVIQICFIHCHSIDSMESLRQSEETKKAFIEYFNQGMSPSEAIRNHEEILLLEAHEYLGNSRNNPPESWVSSLYDEWFEETSNRLQTDSYLARAAEFWRIREKITQPQKSTSSKKNIVKLSKTKEDLVEMEISTDPEISEDDIESDDENLYDSYDEGNTTQVSPNHGNHEDQGKYSASTSLMKSNLTNRMERSRNHCFFVKKGNKGHNYSFINIVPLHATTGSNNKKKSSALDIINKPVISIPIVNAVKTVRIGEEKTLCSMKNDCEVQKLPVVKALPLPSVIRKGRDTTKDHVQNMKTSGSEVPKTLKEIVEITNISEKITSHTVENSSVDFKSEDFGKNIDFYRRSNLHLLKGSYRDIKKSKKSDGNTKNIDTVRKTDLSVVKGNCMDFKKSRKSEEILVDIDANKMNNVFVIKSKCKDCKVSEKVGLNSDAVAVKMDTNVEEMNCKNNNPFVAPKSLFVMVKKKPYGEGSSNEVKQSVIKKETLTSLLQFLRRLKSFQGKDNSIFLKNKVQSNLQHDSCRSNTESENTKLVSSRIDKGIQTSPSVNLISVCAANNVKKIGNFVSKIDQSTQTCEDKGTSINQQSSLQSLNSDLQNCSLSHIEKPTNSIQQNQSKQNSAQSNKPKVVITIHNKEELKNYLLNSGKSSVTADQSIQHSEKSEKKENQSIDILSTNICNADQDNNLLIPKTYCNASKILLQSKNLSNYSEPSITESSENFVDSSDQVDILPSSGNLFGYIDSVYAQQRLKLRQDSKVNNGISSVEKNTVNTSENHDCEDVESLPVCSSTNSDSIQKFGNGIDFGEQCSISVGDSIDLHNSEKMFDQLNNDSHLNYSLPMFGNPSDNISFLQSSEAISTTNDWQHIFSNLSESKNEIDNFDLHLPAIPQNPELVNLCNSLNGENLTANGSEHIMPVNQLPMLQEGILNQQDNTNDNIIEIPENLLDNIEDLSFLQHFFDFRDSDLMGEFESHCPNAVLKKWDLEMERLRNLLVVNIHEEDLMERANKFLEKIEECIKQPADLSTFFASGKLERKKKKRVIVSLLKELGLEVRDGRLRVAQIKMLTKSEDYDEEYVKNLVDTIIEKKDYEIRWF
ncbi:uncharacterized protein TNCT_298861 [Trichonephila clavata]|uniref:Uncharacterized protein n=1 Tax=Trichonephila clavata TaxID=2740835 RepID=A0A8X6L5Q2_TRICU|nr:uncharacterized protein TNCT_298861 [Trichonephila clavata]